MAAVDPGCMRNFIRSQTPIQLPDKDYPTWIRRIASLFFLCALGITTKECILVEGAAVIEDQIVYDDCGWREIIRDDSLKRGYNSLCLRKISSIYRAADFHGMNWGAQRFNRNSRYALNRRDQYAT